MSLNQDSTQDVYLCGLTAALMGVCMGTYFNSPAAQELTSYIGVALREVSALGGLVSLLGIFEESGRARLSR